MTNPTLFLPDVLQEMSQKLAHFDALRDVLFRLFWHLFFESILAPLRRGCRKVFPPMLRALLYIDIKNADEHIKVYFNYNRVIERFKKCVKSRRSIAYTHPPDVAARM